jgi:hypothetical protein
MFNRDVSVIKSANLYSLKKVTRLDSKENMELKAKILIDNKYFSNSEKYNLIVKVNNVVSDVSVNYDEEHLIKNLRKDFYKSRRIKKSKDFTKKIPVKNTSTVSEIVVDININKIEFGYDIDSILYTKNLINLDIIVETDSREVVDCIDNLNFNVFELKVESKKKNFYLKREEREISSKINKLLKSIKLFSSYDSDEWIKIQNLDKEMIKGIENHTFRIVKKSKTSVSNLLKSENENTIDLKIEEILLLTNKSFKKEDLINSKYFYFIISLFMSKNDTPVAIQSINMKNKNIENSIDILIKKENIEFFVKKLFFNNYLPRFLRNKIKCQLISNRNLTFKITFDKNSDFEEYPFFNIIYEKFKDLILFRFKKASIVNNKIVKENIKITFKDKTKTYNINSEDGFFEYMSVLSRSNSTTMFFNLKSKIENNSFLNLEFKLNSLSSRYDFKIIKIPIENEATSIVSYEDSSSKEDFYLDACKEVINIVNNNLQIEYSKPKSVTILLNYADLNKKEIYNFLEYQSFKDFLDSILFEINLDILVKDKKFINYSDIFFLKEFIDESYTSRTTKNLVRKNSRNYKSFGNKYLNTLENSSEVVLNYCIKPVLLRSQIYSNIGKVSTDETRSLLYKDSFKVNPNQSFTFIENQVNIIHSNMSSLNDIKKSILNILHDKNLSYTNSVLVKL